MRRSIKHQRLSKPRAAKVMPEAGRIAGLHSKEDQSCEKMLKQGLVLTTDTKPDLNSLL